QELEYQRLAERKARQKHSCSDTGQRFALRLLLLPAIGRWPQGPGCLLDQVDQSDRSAINGTFRCLLPRRARASVNFARVGAIFEAPLTRCRFWRISDKE